MYSMSPTPSVLIVDDEPILSELLIFVLSDHRIHAVSVTHPQQALTQLQEEHFDVLLTDISLPGIDGIALAELATKSHPHLQVIFMSGYDRREVEQTYGPRHHFLPKPFLVEDLLEMIRTFVANSSCP